MKWTTRLFSNPSFLKGMVSTLDMGSTLTVNDSSEIVDQSDYNSLYSDWAAVGDDFHAFYGTSKER